MLRIILHLHFLIGCTRKLVYKFGCSGTTVAYYPGTCLVGKYILYPVKRCARRDIEILPRPHGKGIDIGSGACFRHSVF